MNIKEMLRQDELPKEIYEICMEIENMKEQRKTNEDLRNAYSKVMKCEEEESNAYKYLEERMWKANHEVNESKYAISQAKLTLEMHPKNKWWGFRGR